MRLGKNGRKCIEGRYNRDSLAAEYLTYTRNRPDRQRIKEEWIKRYIMHFSIVNIKKDYKEVYK